MRNFIDRVKLFAQTDKEFRTALYDIMGFYPHDVEIYRVAFAHKSQEYKSKKSGDRPLNNERLEFLGDAVLETVVSDIVYHRFQNKREGFLTNTRSKIVSRESLGRIAKEIGLERLIQSHTFSRSHNSFIAGNAFEALMGAIYLDRGFEFAFRFIEKKIIGPQLNLENVAQKEVNFKSKLLEYCQKNRLKITLNDKTTAEKANTSAFFTSIIIEGLFTADGKGYSKKEAHQNAAREALLRMRREPQFEDSIYRAKESRTAMEADPCFTLPIIDEIEADIAREKEKRETEANAPRSAEDKADNRRTARKKERSRTAKSEAETVKADDKAAKPEQTVAKSEKSAAKSEQSAAKSEKSAAKSDQTSAKPERKSEKPAPKAVKAEKPAAEKPAKTEKPVLAEAEKTNRSAKPAKTARAEKPVRAERPVKDTKATEETAAETAAVAVESVALAAETAVVAAESAAIAAESTAMTAKSAVVAAASAEVAAQPEENARPRANFFGSHADVTAESTDAPVVSAEPVENLVKPAAEEMPQPEENPAATASLPETPAEPMPAEAETPETAAPEAHSVPVVPEIAAEAETVAEYSDVFSAFAAEIPATDAPVADDPVAAPAEPVQCAVEPKQAAVFARAAAMMATAYGERNRMKAEKLAAKAADRTAIKAKIHAAQAAEGAPLPDVLPISMESVGEVAPHPARYAKPKADPTADTTVEELPMEVIFDDFAAPLSDFASGAPATAPNVPEAVIAEAGKYAETTDDLLIEPAEDSFAADIPADDAEDIAENAALADGETRKPRRPRGKRQNATGFTNTEPVPAEMSHRAEKAQKRVEEARREKARKRAHKDLRAATRNMFNDFAAGSTETSVPSAETAADTSDSPARQSAARPPFRKNPRRPWQQYGRYGTPGTEKGGDKPAEPTQSSTDSAE